MPPKSKDTPPVEPVDPPVEPVDPPVEPAAATVDPAIGTWSVAGPAAVEPAGPVVPFLSEGLRQELEMFGRAGDPATGGRFELDKETGQVTHTDRAGNVTEL